MSASSIPESDGLVISRAIVIPLSEIEIAFTRSGGPGGQHVNKTSTRAEIMFDLAHSPYIPDSERVWLMGRLQSKLDGEGRIHIAAQEFRSQLRNKRAALERLQTMLHEAIKRPKKRKKSKPTKSSVEARLKSKKKASDIKKIRREKF
jgi:ribosome-associated protein